MKVKHHKKSSQSGVTLLIAILVMAGLVLISLAVGSFAIQEIKASRAVALTEPAIAAAESAGEQGLWVIKRAVGSLPDCASSSSSGTFGNGTLASSCQSYGIATFSLKANVPFPFFLYDPNNINSNTCNTVNFNPCSGAQYYQNLTVTHKSGSFQINVQVDTVDGVPVASQTVTPGNTQTIIIPVFVPGSSDLRFKVALTTAGNASVEVNTNQGMPTFPTINAIGCSSKTAVSDCNSASQEIFSRRINITVPQ